MTSRNGSTEGCCLCNPRGDPWVPAHSRDGAGPWQHPPPGCQPQFTPWPQAGLRRGGGAGLVLCPAGRTRGSLTAREAPGRRRGPDPSPPGLATGSAHLSSAVTDTGRDESALSIVTCTQNRAKPCSSPGLRVQVSQERLLNHWELVV